MKIVCCLCLCLIPLLSHAGTLSCQGGWRWLAMAGIDSLQDNGDQTPTAGCRWNSRLTPQRRWLLPAYPPLAYERALPTEYSRSEGYIRYEAWQVSVPLLRLSKVYMLLDITSDYRQQRHQLNDLLRWQGAVLNTGTSLLLDSHEHNYRLTFDLQALETPVSAVWLNYRRQYQPVNVTINQQEVLANALLTSRTLGIGHYPSAYGIHPRLSLAIGQGDIGNDGNTAQLDDAGEQLDYLLLEGYLGIQGRYRAGQHLLLQALAGMKWRYFMLPDGDDTDAIKKDAFTSVDYGISAGLSWRF